MANAGMDTGIYPGDLIMKSLREDFPYTFGSPQKRPLRGLRH